MLTTAYVIMPNHLHCILFFPEKGFSLNAIVGNGKRFMAYEIVERLQQQKKIEILNLLARAVPEKDRKKGSFIRCLKIVLTPNQ